MKLKFLIVSIALFVSNFLGGFDAQTSKTDLLCGEKWQVTSMEANEFKMPVPAGEGMWMKFYKNGQHDVNVDNKLKVGKWEFNKAQDSIFFTTSNGSIKKMKIGKLEAKNLELIFTEGGSPFKINLEKEE